MFLVRERTMKNIPTHLTSWDQLWARVIELSEPEITDCADSAGFSSSGGFSVFASMFVFYYRIVVGVVFIWIKKLSFDFKSSYLKHFF